MNSKVSIISQALNLLGLPPINDIAGFPGNNSAYNAANVWYETLLTGLLSESQPWRFAMVQRELNRLVTPPPTDEWEYQYQIPTSPNYIVNYRVHNGERNITLYDIYEDKVLTNEEIVWMDYIFKPKPDKFPPYFTKLLIFELATVLAMPVTESIDTAKTWATQARTQKLTARAADSAQTPTQRMPSGELFYVHFGNSSQDRLFRES